MEGLDTVLIVDDDKSIVKTLKAMVKLKFSVTTLGVLSSDAALNEIKNTNIDLVISDGYIDNKTGINLYDEIEK